MGVSSSYLSSSLSTSNAAANAFSRQVQEFMKQGADPTDVSEKDNEDEEDSGSESRRSDSFRVA